MPTNQSLVRALNTTVTIQKIIEPNIDSLITLLCGKTGDFTGPLNDGFQTNDWIMICVICSTWLYSLSSISEELSKLSQEDIANLIVDLVTALIRERAIILSEEERELALNILSFAKHIIVKRIVANIEKIFKVPACCCPFFGSNKKVEKILDEQIKSL